MVRRGCRVVIAGEVERVGWIWARASDAVLSSVVVFSSRETRGPHQVPSVGEGGQARLPRHLFAHVWAHGAVRPRPSGAQSHTSASPTSGSHADRRARLMGRV